MTRVDDQLDEFEYLMRQTLEYNMYVNINLNYWEEFDELDPESIAVCERAITGCFVPIINRYRDTPAEKILDTCRDRSRHALFAAMNVAFPRNPLLHVERVVSNIIEIYVVHTYAELRTEMLMSNHHVHILQRTWREAISNPSHYVCRRRLLHEHATLVA
jgi:hypothetical protein